MNASTFGLSLRLCAFAPLRLCVFAFKQPCPVPVAHSLIAVKYRPAAKSKQPDHLQNPLASGVSTRDPLVRARRPTLLSLWAIWMPGRCGYWFASLMVPSPEGWYILCRGRRPRLQVQSKIREARRADTQDLLRHSWSFPRVMCQPSGLCA